MLHKKRIHKNKIYIFLILILMFISVNTCSFLSYAEINDHVYDDYPLADDIIGKTIPESSTAYYQYSKSKFSNVAGQLMSAADYYNCYQYWVPVTAYTQGCFFFNNFDCYIYYQEGLVYSFKMTIDMSLGQSGAFDASKIYFCLFTASMDGSVSSSVDTFESALMSVSKLYKPTKLVQHGVFIELQFDIPFNAIKDWPSLEMVEYRGNKLYRTFGYGIYDGNARNYNKYGSLNLQTRVYYRELTCTAYTESEWLNKQISEEIVEGLSSYDNSLPDHDFSKGKDSLNDYADANAKVESMIDTDAVNDSLDISTIMTSSLNGIKAAGGIVDYMYKNIITYNGIIPIAVCFSGVALLLGLVKNA